jgi:hypothetical protein
MGNGGLRVAEQSATARFHGVAWALLACLGALACAPDVSDPDPWATKPEAEAAPGTLLLTMTLHLENQSFNADYFASLDGFARSFERYGGHLTFEPRDAVVNAAAQQTPAFDWRGLEARGHSVGSHAAIGGTQGMTLEDFTSDARDRHDQLSAQVNRLDHISGNCGDVDWVRGVSDAGFRATTATTVLCLYSMAAGDRPAEYRDLNCRGATDPTCHSSYPAALPQRVHPWRAASGASWLTDTPGGELVIFPGSGTLPCLAEEAASSGRSLPSCSFTEEDVTLALADLDAAIAASDEEQLNTFYWVWGSWSLSSAEQPVLESFLRRVDQRVDQGKVAWRSLGQMLDAYTAWEAEHR